jgi:molybdate transport system ATP-binding protein
VLELAARISLPEFELELELSVGGGRCLALAGPSGAGKSTVLGIASGIRRPDSGVVALAGETWLDTAQGIDLPPERRRCGHLFQDYALFGHLSARRNVAYGLDGLPRRERRRRAQGLLERFGVGELAERRPAELSGGERQRVALARALAPAPNALLLDEPLSALDARTRGRAARELGGVLARVEVPSILVTHDFAEAAMLGDEVAVVDRGRVVQRGTAAELAARPASAFVADFAGAVVLTGTARPGPEGLTEVTLDGGGEARSADARAGRVGLSVYPWEVTLEPAGAPRAGSALNRVTARIASVTEVGNRVRVGLEGSQPLIAEVTRSSLGSMHLEPGTEVDAVWKATASRLTSL